MILFRSAFFSAPGSPSWFITVDGSWPTGSSPIKGARILIGLSPAWYQASKGAVTQDSGWARKVS